MDSLETRLLDQISRIVLIDPHTHVNPLQPAGRHLDDLLGYHYYTELAHSAGMDASALTSADSPDQRIGLLAEFLPRIENTVQFSWMLEIARELFGFQADRIDRANVEQLAELAGRRMAQPDWPEQVFRATRMDAVFLTNDFDDPLTGFDRARYVPCLRADELVFRIGQPAVRERLQRTSGVAVADASGLARAIGAVVERFKAAGARACAIGLPPDFAPAPPQAGAADRALRAMLAGRELTNGESVAVSHFAFWTLAGLCADHGLPFDLMIGAVRGIYPAGVHQGRDLFNRLTSLEQYRWLFNAFSRAVFPVSVIDSAQNPELVAFSWIFPNVLTCGHWWYANIPSLIERDLRQRLSAVPRTKQIGYYSDAYKLEFCLPKFNIYRRVLARVLADEFVRDRGWSEEKAVALAGDLLRGNIERVFLRRPA